MAWARAAFEQEALSSLLLLQGLVPIFTLPGDKMFQSTGIHQGRQRPPIMHAYGGAKVGMAHALKSIAGEGWVPLAVAMMGTKGKILVCGRSLVPLWTLRLRHSHWKTESWDYESCENLMVWPSWCYELWAMVDCLSAFIWWCNILIWYLDWLWLSFGGVTS